MDNQWRLKELFDQAVELPAADRDAFLARHCGADSALRSAVDSLLDAHERAGSFLADPTLPFDPGAMNSERLPARIGPYLPLRVLGEGGYGTVYLVAEDAPLRRHLALKVIKPGMDSQQVMARFELERQALAMMDHANIAQVVCAGATDAGRPYFVLEFVDGPPITQYCRQHRLSIHDRLLLFIDLCDAMQHAHQKGIIHRDIKPSNVLVTEKDGKPVLKIIDFGISKALNRDEHNPLAFTQTLQLLGTPQFMSPEQAQLQGADVDTRSDIYSMGILLYEMLTDLPPLDPEQLRATSLDEVLRIVREVDPPPPSVRCRLSASNSASGQHEASDAEKRTAHVLRGDLDWIVMKALEKDRNRRYATAEAFAADVTRHLQHEPVSAGPPSRTYRFRKFAYRNRALLFTGAMLAATLIVGFGVSVYQFLEARHQRDNAIAARNAEAIQLKESERLRKLADANAAKAEREAGSVRTAQAFLYHLFISDPGNPLESTPPQEVLNFIAQRADVEPLGNHPEVEAPLRGALGDAYLSMRLYPAAVRQYQRNLELQRLLTPGESLNLASSMHNLGMALIRNSQIDDAGPYLRDSLAMYRRILGKDTIASAPALESWALWTALSGDFVRAEPMMRQVLALYRGKYAEDNLHVQRCLRLMAGILDGLGSNDEADKFREEARESMLMAGRK